MIRVLTLLIMASLLQALPALSQGDLDAASGEALDIEDVVSSPSYYDGRYIVVEGKVTRLEYRRSPKGDHYTIIRLEDSNDNDIGVYTKGILDIEEGSTVRVYGKFNKEKKYLFFRFKNVLKARQVELLS
jgi:hypothetical protein